MIRALIVDDEPLGRDGVRMRLAALPDIEIVGEAVDGLDAVEKILALEPDLVFLDVQMPEINGFEVLARVAHRHLPVVVFVSAYDRFAIQAFEIHALDYLLKPYSTERFDDTLRRVRRELARSERESPAKIASLLESGATGVGSGSKTDVEVSGVAAHAVRASGAPMPLTRFVVQDRDRFVLISAAEVGWIEAAGNYVEIHARGATFLARHTMKDLEARLDRHRFARIHRSVIVALDRVRDIRAGDGSDYEVTLHDGRVLPMSRTYRSAVLDKA